MNVIHPSVGQVEHYYFVIARLVRATHFSCHKKMGRPHEAGDDNVG
jgi:hypothetical protein